MEYPTHPTRNETSQPENLTHTSQSALETSEISQEPVIQAEQALEHGISSGNGLGKGAYEGMSEEEIFRMVTKPPEIEGKLDWGIPPEVDPVNASAELKVGVDFGAHSVGAC